MIAFLNLIDSEEDKEKFTRLYNKYKNLLYWIAYSKTKSVEAAEECVQETFFYAAKNFHKIGDVDSNKTKGYLSVIVTGFAIDVFNKSIKFQIVPDEEENVSSSYFDNFGNMELASAFDKVLDDESKIFFYLKYLYDYRIHEIAQIYDVKEHYVRRKLQKAKNDMKKYLEKEGWGNDRA